MASNSTKNKWIQNAIKKPGALTAMAKRAGKSLSEYCSGSNLSTKATRRRWSDGTLPFTVLNPHFT